MKKTTTIPKTAGIIQLPAKFIAAASTDKTREVINGVLIDADNRAVVATNGRILASVPIPGKDAIKPGYITPELWKSATIMAKKGPIILDYVHGTIANLPYLSMEEWNDNYPNWKAAVPEISNPVYRTRIDPELLMNAANALGFSKDSKDCKGLTLDFAAECDSPIVLRVGPHSSGVIITMTDENNSSGHGLRIQTAESGVMPERSPIAAPLNIERFTIDRTEMLKDPIKWLRRLDDELRYLTDFTPFGNFIFDYLAVGQTAREFNDMEDKLEEAEASNESSDEKIKDYEQLISRIVQSLEETTFESIDSTAGFLHELNDMLSNADIADMYNSTKIHGLIESFAEITVPKSEADFESMKAERDQLQARNEALTKELTHSRNRITAYEISAKQRLAIADHAAKSTPPEHSPAPSTEPTPIQLASLPPILTRNGPKNGIELRFDGKPTDLTLDAMKALGFRWAPGQPDKPWIAKYTEERWIFATALAEGKSVEPADPTPEIVGVESPAPQEQPQAPILKSQALEVFADF